MMIPPWVDPGAGIPTKAILQKKQKWIILKFHHLHPLLPSVDQTPRRRESA